MCTFDSLPIFVISKPNEIMSDKKIKVCIVEDDLEFQEWVRAEVEEAENIEVLDAYDVAEDAIKAVPDLKPDVVIMDLTLEKSDISGIECMLRLRLVAPELKFLVMTSNSDENILYEALYVGAGAYIQKGDIPRRLSILLEEFHAGGAPMSPGIAKKVIENFHRIPEDLLRLKALSNRETQTLELLSKGFLYKEVASHLKIAEGTVKQHAHNIYKKLHVNNIVEAVRKYLNR